MQVIECTNKVFDKPIKIKQFDITSDQLLINLQDPNNSKTGVFCFIVDNEITNIFKDIYQRENIVLKVFDKPIVGNPLDFLWGYDLRVNIEGHQSPLIDATIAQNMLSTIYKLAPRVYDLVILNCTDTNKKYFAQVVQFIHGGCDTVYQTAMVYNQVFEACQNLPISPCYADVNAGNSIHGKWVDFQGFRLEENFKQQIIEKLKRQSTWANNHYQSVTGIADGFRKTETRIKDMKLDTINFKNKKILDVGCSGGQFCMYAVDHGASQVLGIDYKSVIESTAMFSYINGYHNVDYIGVDIQQDKPNFDDNQFDITFFLSMYMHVGFPKWVADVTKELLIFEKNGYETDEQIIDELGTYFKHIELVGKATDFDNRSIFFCHK